MTLHQEIALWMIFVATFLNTGALLAIRANQKSPSGNERPTK